MGITSIKKVMSSSALVNLFVTLLLNRIIQETTQPIFMKFGEKVA